MLTLDNTKIAVIGLGYVGLPLAVEFGKKFEVKGYDINRARIKELKKRSQIFVKQCLQESVKQKLISDEISPEAIAIIILGSILSIGHSSTRVASKHAVKNLSQEVWQAIQKMLCPAITSKEN